MKKEVALDDIYINISRLPNPASQESLESLPKIYGNIKHRIYTNKHKFYQVMEKSFKRKRDKKSEEKSLESKRSAKRLMKQKFYDRIEREANKELKFSVSKNKIKKHPNKELWQGNNTTQQIQQAKILTLKKQTHDQQPSKRKIKLRLNAMATQSSPRLEARPQTLSQLVDSKIRKSINNPLVKLYKKKHQKLSLNGSDQQIRESAFEGSFENSPKHRYIPKYLIRNAGLRKSGEQRLVSSYQKELKTEANSLAQSELKRGINKTEFGRRITENSFEKMSKLIPIDQNDKFKIPHKDQYKQFTTAYQPINPSFNLRTLSTKQTFQIISSEKSVYFGQFNGSMHGFGLLITPDCVYEGYFQNGQKVKGSQMNYDGIYTGNYSNNLREGNGRLYWNNGQIYDGEWKAGRKNGFGVWRNSEGDSYEGQWANGRQQGVGTRKRKNNIYKGELLNGIKHGKGEQYFQNGDHYRGSYQHGKPHGFGRYEWKDGSYYEGEFVNGYREGEGQLQERSGSTYKGSFRRDFKHGVGQQIQQSGHKVSGIFQDGELVQLSQP